MLTTIDRLSTCASNRTMVCWTSDDRPVQCGLHCGRANNASWLDLRGTADTAISTLLPPASIDAVFSGASGVCDRGRVDCRTSWSSRKDWAFANPRSETGVLQTRT